MRGLAARRGGRCLSSTYTNAHKKLRWKCEREHIWRANANNVRSGQWCPTCGRQRAGLNRRLTIAQMRSLAASHGGRCLSTEYENSDLKLRWQCSQGHVWTARPHSVKRGHWCPECAGNTPLDLNHARDIARQRGGKCISSRYVASHRPLKWKCAEGHTWSAPLARVKSGSWCPKCSVGLGERICRAFFEQLFRRRFPHAWPDWLTNSDGHRMELDGYCKVLSLAFEHQGLQHFREMASFHTPAQFEKRRRDDRRKGFLCRQQRVTLIRVPQIPAQLPVPEMRDYILEQCRRAGYRYPWTAENAEVVLRDAYSPSSRQRFDALRHVVEARGGRCLSSAWLGAVGHLRFRCAKAHEWEAIPYSILKGHWCPRCSAAERGLSRRLTIELLQEIAMRKGGKCLARRYDNANAPVLWECAKGHRWQAIPNSVKRGSWCLQCAGKARKTISEMHQLAAEHGGRCLSSVYLNCNTKLRWRCGNGHTWEATPRDVGSGRWCPHCAGRRWTIVSLRDLARRRGGQCLSQQYRGSRSKHLWQCAEGHRWHMTFDQVKNGGSWCPACARQRARGPRGTRTG
jgi:hypothetical protein